MIQRAGVSATGSGRARRWQHRPTPHAILWRHVWWSLGASLSIRVMAGILALATLIGLVSWARTGFASGVGWVGFIFPLLLSGLLMIGLMFGSIVKVRKLTMMGCVPQIRRAAIGWMALCGVGLQVILFVAFDAANGQPAYVFWMAGMYAWSLIASNGSGKTMYALLSIVPPAMGLIPSDIKPFLLDAWKGEVAQWLAWPTLMLLMGRALSLAWPRYLSSVPQGPASKSDHSHVLPKRRKVGDRVWQQMLAAIGPMMGWRAYLGGQMGLLALWAMLWRVQGMEIALVDFLPSGALIGMVVMAVLPALEIRYWMRRTVKEQLLYCLSGRAPIRSVLNRALGMALIRRAAQDFAALAVAPIALLVALGVSGIWLRVLCSGACFVLVAAAWTLRRGAVQRSVGDGFALVALGLATIGLGNLANHPFVWACALVVWFVFWMASLWSLTGQLFALRPLLGTLERDHV